MTYKKKPSQQYVLQRKKVISKVESKLKKAGKTKEKSEPPATIAETPTATSAQAPVEALPSGRKATLHFKNEGLSITAKVRYESEKVDPLIKTVNVADGKTVYKRYVGPAKKLVWLDDEGKEHDAKKVQTMQQLDDGKLVPIKITQTKDIKVEPVPEKVMNEFHPYSFLEVWGEGEEDNESLRELAFNLETKGQVGAVKKFSRGYGKMYIGFVNPS